MHADQEETVFFSLDQMNNTLAPRIILLSLALLWVQNFWESVKGNPQRGQTD